MYDPLDETVAANDITGRNNCPLHLRITGIWQLGETQSRNFLFTDASCIDVIKENYRERKRMRSLSRRET